MNAERLLTHCERIADTPVAIGRIRRFILDLAVRGKLVPQDPSDEPASTLLKRIAAAKYELKSSTGDTRIRFAPNSEPGQLAIPLPSGWSVQSFENLFLFIDYRGKTPTKTKAGVPLITAKNVRLGYLDRDPREYVSTATFMAWMTRGLPRYGDLFFTTEAPLANVCVNDLMESFALAQRVICLQPYAKINTKFVMFALMSDLMQSMFSARATGLTAKGIKAAKLKPLPIPVPPLAEQHRIVTKVDEVMALCDRLEAARTEREVTRDRLTTASLGRLNAPDLDPATFANRARFILNALPTLTARPDQIKQLRKTIFNLAVRGHLSARQLWPRTTIALGDVAKVQNGYAFKSEWFSRDGIRLLRNINVSHGIVRWDDVTRLPKSRAAAFERFRLNAGDIVLSLDRPFIVTGTKVARVRHSDLPCLLLQRVGRFQPDRGRISEEFLFLWLHSPLFTEQIAPGRSTGVPHVSSKQVEAAEIFVPPLAEQHVIVAKTNELMALCDRLEANITNGDETRSRLLDALLAQALASTDKDAMPVEAARVAAHG